MVTEKQYAFFRALYDEEAARERQLNELARSYLSLATLYSAFVLFVVDKLRPDSVLALAVLGMAVASMLGCFLLSVWATRVSDYEALTTPASVLDELGDAGLADEDFFDNSIADYVVACGRNAVANGYKSQRLRIAGYALLLGITLQSCYLMLKIGRDEHGQPG